LFKRKPDRDIIDRLRREERRRRPTGTVFIVLGLALTQGIRLRFGGRKDRMLIHYFDLSNGEKVSPEPLRPS
jgi:hypothetical protein